MIKVLCITGILPIPEIERKKNENDIILVTEDKILERYPHVKFEYLFILPYVNRMLSVISGKWRSYYQLIKRRTYPLRNRQIRILGIIMLPKETWFRGLFYELSYLITRKYIHRIYDNFAPTIIHAQNTNSAAFLAKKLSKKYGTPYVVTLRGLNFINDKVTKKLLTGAKKLVALSPTQQAVGSNIIKDKTVLISHGLDESYFVGSMRSFDHAGPIRLISVGRLLKLKNIDKVISALSRIDEDYIYDIFGEGPEKEYLFNLVQSLNLADKIKIQGFLPHAELSSKFLSYDVFVMISFPESFGRVYIEAMASGLPVVATENTGIDGIITEGREGFLLNHKDDEQIFNLLNRIVTKQIDLGAMAPHAIKLAETFKWEEIVEKFKELYS